MHLDASLRPIGGRVLLTLSSCPILVSGELSASIVGDFLSLRVSIACAIICVSQNTLRGNRVRYENMPRPRALDRLRC
jgi:hypothetical protein